MRLGTILSAALSIATPAMANAVDYVQIDTPQCEAIYQGDLTIDMQAVPDTRRVLFVGPRVMIGPRPFIFWDGFESGLSSGWSVQVLIDQSTLIESDTCTMEWIAVFQGASTARFACPSMPDDC